QKSPAAGKNLARLEPDSILTVSTNAEVSLSRGRTPQIVSAPHLRGHILSLRLRYTNTKSSTTARVFSMPGGTRSSSRGKGGGAAMTSGVKRATRNSGIAVDVNLWDLR
ncbi:unnamed protein product, partial [Ectocarpus sp. 4 AP-2014]